MACHPPYSGTRICPPQRGFSGCSFPSLWMVPISSTISLHLWTYSFTVEHALICTHGVFPSIHHNELKDITAGFLTEVCHNVGTEPQLQPLSGKQLTLQSTNREDGARLDIAADDFWGGDRNCAFFDVRVFSPFAQSHRNTSLSQCYMKNERDKRRAYDQRIREVERGSFSPLVFSAAGGMGPTASVVYKRITSMLSQKYDQAYSKTLYWIRCKLSYSLLRSAVMCLRVAHSSIHHPAPSPETMDLACHESHQRSGAWILLSPGFFRSRRNGTNSLQENYINESTTLQ